MGSAVDVHFPEGCRPFDLELVDMVGGRSDHLVDLHLVQNIAVARLKTGIAEGHDRIFSAAHVGIARMGNGSFEIDGPPLFRTGDGPQLPQRQHGFFRDEGGGKRSQRGIGGSFLVRSPSRGKGKSQVGFPQRHLKPGWDGLRLERVIAATDTVHRGGRTFS